MHFVAKFEARSERQKRGPTKASQEVVSRANQIMRIANCVLNSQRVPVGRQMWRNGELIEWSTEVLGVSGPLIAFCMREAARPVDGNVALATQLGGVAVVRIMRAQVGIMSFAGCG